MDTPLKTVTARCTYYHKKDNEEKVLRKKQKYDKEMEK